MSRTDGYGVERSRRGWNQNTGVCGHSHLAFVRVLLHHYPYLSVQIRTYPFERRFLCRWLALRVSVTHTSACRCPQRTYRRGEKRSETGNVTHSEDPNFDSPEKAGQGRGICGCRYDKRWWCFFHKPPPTEGDGRGVVVRHKPNPSTPFRNISNIIAEKCECIFLGLQGENLAEGCGGEEPPHQKNANTRNSRLHIKNPRIPRHPGRW